MNFLIDMAPPAAASNPRPPMGIWEGALGKLGWAKIIEEKTYGVSKVTFGKFPNCMQFLDLCKVDTK